MLGEPGEGSEIDRAVLVEGRDNGGENRTEGCFWSVLHGGDGSREGRGNLALMGTSEFIKDVNADAFPLEVLQQSREVPVVVDFWAEWCQPCKILSPALERVTEEAEGAFELVKVDVDGQSRTG